MIFFWWRGCVWLRGEVACGCVWNSCVLFIGCMIFCVERLRDFFTNSLIPSLFF